MTSNKHQHFIGIDVSKQTLDVCLWTVVKDDKPLKTTFATTNDPTGHKQLDDWLSLAATPQQAVICLENTGLYDEKLVDWLTVSGWCVAVENTSVLSKVRNNAYRKSDALDADLLAEYAYRFTDQLSIHHPQPPVIKEIQLLYRERRRLVSQRASVKQLVGESGYRITSTAFAKQLWEQQIQFYTNAINEIEKRIHTLIKSDSEMSRYYKILVSIAGIGPIASWLWLTTFYGQHRLIARRIASRFGFAPHEKRSGTSVRCARRSSGHGNSEMRKVMTMCARSAATHHPRFALYRQRKLQEGKPPQLVTNNIINKLIRIMTAIWNSGEIYDENHSPCLPQIASSS